MLQTILNYITSSLPLVLGIIALVFLIPKCFTNIKSDEIGIKERKWFGKEMSEGRTIALPGEVGIQARILGPGLKFIIPFVENVTKQKFITIGMNQTGYIKAITGASIPSGEFFAAPVECSLFQDGEAFLKNGGQKGPQLQVLPPGQHRINTKLFDVSVMDIVSIQDDEIGIVESIAGASCEVGRIFGTPVDCDSYQDAQAFLKNGGQKGPQIAILPPGSFRVNGLLFNVEIKKQTKIPGGKIGLITAMDGARIPEGRLLATKVDGHSNFEKGDMFMKNGGEKGRQIDILMPGMYRINTTLFEVSEVIDQTQIKSDEVGIVTVREGRPILKQNQIAADELDLEIHSNFQDPAAFLKAGGQKGLQIPMLRSGVYAINTWFAEIKKESMVEVEIGECIVVTNFVGEEGDDVTDENVNAKIVQNGKKGIWAEPLGPGKHPLNTGICKYDRVPTTQILLNWADNESSAHKFDANLKTITLRTADAFNVNMDVSVIIHIAMKDAPKVIANLGSVSNMISQVLEPAISSHFRNSAQSVKALDLYTKRAQIQEEAKKHIQEVLKNHHIESKDTMIADVVLPEALTKTVTDRQIAEQEKATYKTQREAQDERRTLENAKAQADMQPKVVESERNVEIQKNIAEGKVMEAEGSKKSSILQAEGSAKAVELAAEGKAKATKLNADADAEAITKVGNADAEIILAKGKSTAEAYKLEVEAMGKENFGRIKMINKIAESNMKLIPDNIIVGGEGGSNTVENFLGISMVEKLTGKKFADFSSEDNKEEKK